MNDPDSLADRIVARGLTVRDIERLGANSGRSVRRPVPPINDPDTFALEENLSLRLAPKYQ